MVVDDLGDDEGEELLGEDRVESGLTGQRPQSRDLHRLTGGVGRRQVQLGLEVADALGAAEALGQKVHQCGVEVVDRGAVARQLRGHLAGRGGRLVVDGRDGVPAVIGPLGNLAHAVRVLSPAFEVALSVPDPAS